MVSIRSRFTTIVLLIALGAATSEAQNVRSDVYVPPELQPWQEWVLKDKEHLGCPFFFNNWGTGRGNFVCAWPGALELEADADGGRFRQSWTVYAGEQWVPLPGDRRVWPDQVSADGRGIELVLRNGVPMIRLGPGRYALAGRFAWDERPSTLRIPRQSGLISLSVDGKRIPRPDRSSDGVWLGEPRVEQAAEDSLITQVYRLIRDDVPTRLVTVIELDVSGSVREEILGPALPDGFTPLRLSSDLPARVEPDGKLRIQVRPGSWEVLLAARAGTVLDSVGISAETTNLPDAEIWSYRSNDRLRVTSAEGLPAVDPVQVAVPEDWRELPAFQFTSGGALSIVERSRGLVSADNRLTLDRRMWLDFDRAGFSVSDTITGRMRSGWRLDMAVPYELHSARAGGDNLLVTVGDDETLTGIEVRSGSLFVQGDGRSETRGAMPASGWQTRFDAVNTVLNLPPGNKLLAAIGADESPGAWVDRWQLLDFFLVLITTIAALRIFGRTAAVIAFVALTLSWHEVGAPQWIWLNLLLAVALARVAPAGRLRNSAVVYRGLSLIALVVLLVPFVAGQLRVGIFPQLEPQGTRAPAWVLDRNASLYGAGDPKPEAPAAARETLDLAQDAIEEIAVSAARQTYARYAPDAVVRAGPGRPDWHWNTYRLGWSGPVDPERAVRLVILPPWLVSGLRFVAVILILGFAAYFVLEALGKRLSWPGGSLPGAAAAGVPFAMLGSAAILGLAAPLGTVRADTPSAEILQELEQRLLEPPDCAPTCAEIVAADIDVASESMDIELQVHALESVAVPLPGSLGGWRPQALRLGGSGVPYVYRSNDDTLWIEVPPGRHAVELSGPLPPVDSVSVPFPAGPRAVDVNADGWFVAGVQDRRLVSGALQLTRLREDDSTAAAARWESDRFPVFVRVERSVDLGLDWSVTTRVTRIAPERGALTIDVPLLEGESVLTEDLPVSDGEITVSMNPGQSAVQWSSGLPRTTPLTLSAAADAPWKEVWRVSIGHLWRVSFDGVPESEPETAAAGARIAEFYPRREETLSLDVARPEATSGGTMAFDRVDLNVAVGGRSRNSSLSLMYRATRGAQHTINLPADAELTSVTLDGAISPLSASEGELDLPILPGEHRIVVNWMQAADIGVRERTPAVDLGAPSSNIDLHLNLPAGRWILATGGPAQGPAVLYWPELAAMILFAAILGRVKITPLATRQWLLLGLGFSTFSWPVLALVAIWLIAAGARARWSGEVRWWRFDLVQIVLALVTLAALVAIVVSVPSGLLGTPDMHIRGYGSYSNSLNWFSDRSAAVLPRASVFSVPLWVYKALILAWALWLSFALLRWLPWVWQCFSHNGLWRSRPGKKPKAQPVTDTG